MIRRFLLVFLALSWCGVGFAAPAAAHVSSDRITATNYETRLDTFSPEQKGISLEVIELGDRLRLTNHTPTDVVVEGYDHEPYLRVGREGVYANTRSPAHYLNTTRNGDVPVPPHADAKAEPEWERLSSSTSVSWHDHRVHWVAPQRPAVVQADPSKRHVIIPKWTVPMRYGDQPLLATGSLSWAAEPSPWPWYVGIVALFGAMSMGLSRAKRPTALIISLVMLVAIDVVHTGGNVFALDGVGSAQLADAAQLVFPSVIAWSIGVYAAVRFRKRAEDAAWFGLFASAVIAALGGLTDVETLHYALLASALPAWATRTSVALSIGLGLAVLVTCVRQVRAVRASTNGLSTHRRTL